MKISFQTLAVILILPLAACSSTPTSHYADNTFDTYDYMQGLAPDAPILQRKGTIFGTMNF